MHRIKRHFLRLTATIFMVVLPLIASADPTTAKKVVIEEPWARASIGTSRPAVVYLTVRNRGDSDDRLIGIKTPAAANVMVHESKTVNGVASMSPAGPLTIPAEGEVKLQPGGLHMMLSGLKEPLIEGDEFLLTLIFEKNGAISVQVPVYGLGASGPGR
jgi:copper(I)-binding protein